MKLNWWKLEKYEKEKIVEKKINIGGKGKRNEKKGMMMKGDKKIVKVKLQVI